MSQRVSGFDRQGNEQYMTPEWVVEILCSFVNFRGMKVWEPAAGESAFVNVLRRHGAEVFATDIDPRFGHRVHDFVLDPVLNVWTMPSETGFAVATNPPYGKQGRLADRFVRVAMEMCQLNSGIVAMLLPVDWDAAKTRQDLFEDFPGHITKVTLTTRIRWTNIPQAKSGPSENHALFIWNHGRTRGREMYWRAQPKEIAA